MEIVYYSSTEHILLLMFIVFHTGSEVTVAENPPVTPRFRVSKLDISPFPATTQHVIPHSPVPPSQDVP